MPCGSLPGASPSSDVGCVHTKMPELPADFKCCHWATSSKLVYCFCERMTPTGWPVQCATPPVHDQVSGLQFTFLKSLSPSCTQPGPVPSTNALGRLAGSSA